jgi:hypothetical protein
MKPVRNVVFYSMCTAVAVGLWFVASLGCGGEETTPRDGVAQEAAFGSGEGVFSTGAPGYPSMFIQQVPIGTSPTALLAAPQATRYDFSVPNIATLTDGITHDGVFNVDPSNDDFRLALTQSGYTSSSNNINCNVSLAGITGIYNGGQGQIFGNFWPANFHINTPPNAVYYVGVRGTGKSAACAAVGGQWAHTASGVYVSYIPVGTGKPHGGTLAGGAPYELFVRIDVDFPESGVTNRYFYVFVRTSP